VRNRRPVGAPRAATSPSVQQNLPGRLSFDTSELLPAGARQPEGPAFDDVDEEAIRVHGQGRPPSGGRGLAEGIPIDLERSATLPTALAGPFDPGLHSISISWHPRPAPLLSSTGNPKKNIVILHSLSLPHQGAKMVPKGVAPSSRGRAHDLVREELLRPVAGLIDEVPETREVPEAGGVDRHAG